MINILEDLAIYAAGFMTPVVLFVIGVIYESYDSDLQGE
jgi:hypothetical protein